MPPRLDFLGIVDNSIFIQSEIKHVAFFIENDSHGLLRNRRLKNADRYESMKLFTSGGGLGKHFLQDAQSVSERR
jgi:hypothetical protein